MNVSHYCISLLALATVAWGMYVQQPDLTPLTFEDEYRALRNALDMVERDPPAPEEVKEEPVPLNDQRRSLDSETETQVALALRATVHEIYGVNLDDIGSTHPNGKLRAGQATHTHTCDTITSVPSALRDKANMFPEGIQSHYTKYTEAYGIPILGSNNVKDEGLRRACYEIVYMLAGRYDVRNAYYKLFGRIALIGDNEQQCTLPEYSTWDASYWNSRARGLGATRGIPTTSVGDSNMRCHYTQRYKDQDILCHEFGHGVHLMGSVYVVKGFARAIGEVYRAAIASGMWGNTYAGSNMNEYFATGMQFYLEATSGFAVRPSGASITVKDRATLQQYDPALFDLLEISQACDPSQFIERCDYKGQSTPSVTSLCASGPDGTARCSSVASADRKTCGPSGTTQAQCGKMGCCWSSSMCHYPANDCLDDSFSCAEFAMNGDCTRNPVHATLKCPFTCNLCEEKKKAQAAYTSSELAAMCQDKSSNCPGWFNAGYCTKSYVSYMKSNCPLICGHCTISADPFGDL